MMKRKRSFLGSRELKPFVDAFLKRREVFLRAVGEHGSPLYLIEEEVLRERARRFVGAFRAFLPDLCVYYAVKSNPHPAVVKTFADAGLGLDVSSGKELKLALESGAGDIVFSGPGKTAGELALAAQHRDRVTVLIDSFGELERLKTIASKAGNIIRTGVRLTTDERALWAKFGIPPRLLADFFGRAGRSSHIRLCGLQFHTSWNLEPSAQIAFIRRLGKALSELDEKDRAKVEFIDIGGGYWPEKGEWLHRADGKAVDPRAGALTHPYHYRQSAALIEEFAERIGRSFRRHIFPRLKCRVYAEPGRWLVQDAMHILLTVVDKKRPHLVITDAGTNAVGWERFETDYFPVINLSRPATTEHQCHILGSLCTPHDVWGYYYHGRGIRPGDTLLIPAQGAYTYSLRQEFIKPLPETVLVRASGAVGKA